VEREDTSPVKGNVVRDVLADKYKLSCMTDHILKIHPLVFEDVRLPRFGFFLDVAAAIASVPEETAVWFWHFSICVGASRQERSSVIERHAGMLLAALPSQPDTWSEELQRRLPGQSSEELLRDWRASLDLILRVAREKKVCSWHAGETNNRQT